MKRANNKMPIDSTAIVAHIAIRNRAVRSGGVSPPPSGTRYLRFFLRAAFSALRLSRARCLSFARWLPTMLFVPGGV